MLTHIRRTPEPETGRGIVEQRINIFFCQHVSESLTTMMFFEEPRCIDGQIMRPIDMHEHI